MTNVEANEVFINFRYCKPSNWTLPLLAERWDDLEDLGDGFWVLTDHMGEQSGTNYDPKPLNTSTNGNDESLASEVTVHEQQLRIGSTFNGGRGGSPAQPDWPVDKASPFL